MSRCLSDRSIDHVVLERSEVANSWRTERWDSLRLLTPNWQCRLPGYAYRGDDPDGFMTMPEVVEFITGYAKDIAAPVQTGTTVTSVRRTDDGYRVTTDHGEWQCLTVVLATGAFNVPRVPAVRRGGARVGDDAHADGVPQSGRARRGWGAGRRRVGDRRADRARDPALGPSGHVGRRESTSRASRRTGAGTSTGGWRRRACSTSATTRWTTSCARAACRRCSSAGSPERATFDLNALTGHRREAGRPPRRHPRRPRPVLRVVAEQVRPRRPQARPVARHRSTSGRRPTAWTTTTPPPHRFAPTVVSEPPTLGLDLASGAIQTIIWATGFRPDYSWLDVTVLDGKGMVRHDGGVVDSPGMYLIGTPFLRRRKSSFMDGARDDAQDLIVELAGFLDRQASPTKH